MLVTSFSTNTTEMHSSNKMPVSGPEDSEKGWRTWLMTHPREVCLAISIRTALRVLPVLYVPRSRRTEGLFRFLSTGFRACALSWIAVKHSRYDQAFLDKLAVYAALANEDISKISQQDDASAYAGSAVIKAVKLTAQSNSDGDGTKKVLQHAAWAGDSISVDDDYAKRNERLCLEASSSIWKASSADAKFIISGGGASEILRA
jgi:hypothetical protein